MTIMPSFQESLICACIARSRMPRETVLVLQVPEAECVLYDNDRVRRPIPEEKAIKIAVEAIKASFHHASPIGAKGAQVLSCAAGSAADPDWLFYGTSMQL